MRYGGPFITDPGTKSPVFAGIQSAAFGNNAAVAESAWPNISNCRSREHSLY